MRGSAGALEYTYPLALAELPDEVNYESCSKKVHACVHNLQYFELMVGTEITVDSYDKSKRFDDCESCEEEQMDSKETVLAPLPHIVPFDKLFNAYQSNQNGDG